jgi:hypothetical protein
MEVYSQLRIVNEHSMIVLGSPLLSIGQALTESNSPLWLKTLKYVSTPALAALHEALLVNAMIGPGL